MYRKDKREGDGMDGGDKRERVWYREKLWIVGRYREEEREDDSV